VKVLLVSDGFDASLEEKLESLGFIVEFVDKGNIRKGVERFEPDLVLVYTRPAEDLELEGFRDLDMILLVDLEEFNIRKAILTPPYLHINKPFSVRELERAMNLIIRMKEEKDRYKKLFRHTDSCVAVLQAINNGKDFIFKDLNPAAERESQVRNENIIGKKMSQATPRNAHLPMLKLLQRVYKTGEVEHFSFTPYYKDGKIIKWKQGTIYKSSPDELVVVYQDIAKEKQLIEELRKREDYKAIFDNSGAGTIIVDEDTTILLANKRFEELSGYSKEELEDKKSWTEFILKEDLEKMKKYHKLRRKDPSLAPQRYTFRAYDREGKIKHIQITIGMIPGTKKSVASLIDITELKEAEGKIREREERYRALVETAPNNILIFDKSGNILEVNKRLLEISGFKKEDLIGKNIKELASKVKVDLKEIMNLFEQTIKGEKIEEKVRTFTNLKGEKIYYIAYPSTLKKNSKTIGLSLIIENVTERYKAEKRIKESLKEKETLLREIHHRVKNNMQIIQSLLNLQVTRIKEEKAQRVLQESQGRIKAMSMIHEHLYQSETLAQVNIKEYIEKLLEDLVIFYKAKIKKKLEIENIHLDIDTAIPLGLIINELVTNALKYAFPTGKGTITIKLTTQKDKIELIIVDDGIGLPESIDIEKTETLGLKLVNILTMQLNGKISLKTRPGTQFKITFPYNLSSI